MGHRQHGIVFAQRAQRGTDRFLGIRIERARGLVENHQPRLVHKRSRDDDALALASRETTAVLPHVGVHAIGQAGHEIRGPGLVECGMHISLDERSVAQHDVL